MKGFNETYKVVVRTDTHGGAQSVLFLTELGLYRLLGMSRKPFQEWVGKVIREIRLTGKYEIASVDASDSEGTPDIGTSSAVDEADIDPPPPPAANLFPPEAKKRLGRPPRPKVVPESDGTALSGFLESCFDLNPEAKTHVAHVRARHRLWRGKNVEREETTDLIEFFKQRFQVVQEMDDALRMKCSFYKGIAMKPWVSASIESPDITAFVREKCEVDVMGRAKTSDLWEEFVAWKKCSQTDYDPTPKERNRLLGALKTAFVYYTGIAFSSPVMPGGSVPGFYGLYLKTATPECRAAGYNRSPNTHNSLIKLDALGNVVDILDSQDAFAHGVANKSSQYICNQLTKCFKDGMKGYKPGDGFSYMRARDHETVLLNKTSL